MSSCMITHASRCPAAVFVRWQVSWLGQHHHVCGPRAGLLSIVELTKQCMMAAKELPLNHACRFIILPVCGPTFCASLLLS